MLRDVHLTGMRCGSGRWSRWLAARGALVTGIDPTSEMLAAARASSPGLDLPRISATAIELPAESSDLVLAVTVIQHLLPDEQELAARQKCRVLRPGGRLFVLDLIDSRDAGAVVYPRSPIAWINLYARHGLVLERFQGQEWVPLFRSLQRLRSSRQGAAATLGDPSAQSLFERLARIPGAFWPLWPLVKLSAPLELLCERVLPARWARNGCFFLRKPDSAVEAESETPGILDGRDD
jgi:SAM-dependent methyltransferase